MKMMRCLRFSWLAKARLGRVADELGGGTSHGVLPKGDRVHSVQGGGARGDYRNLNQQLSNIITGVGELLLQSCRRVEAVGADGLFDHVMKQLLGEGALDLFAVGKERGELLSAVEWRD